MKQFSLLSCRIFGSCTVYYSEIQKTCKCSLMFATTVHWDKMPLGRVPQKTNSYKLVEGHTTCNNRTVERAKAINYVKWNSNEVSPPWGCEKWGILIYEFNAMPWICTVKCNTHTCIVQKSHYLSINSVTFLFFFPFILTESSESPI